MVRGNGKRRKSMNRKSKLFFSLVSLCFSIAVLCFGVYSALSVSYSISGSVSYELQDVFVDIETSLFMSTEGLEEAKENVHTNISNLEQSLKNNQTPNNMVKSSYLDTHSTYNNGQVDSRDEITFTNQGNELSITYGNFVQGESAYSYFVVIKITNYAENSIGVTIIPNIQNLNTLTQNNFLSKNVAGAEEGAVTEYFILSMTLDDATLSVNGNFDLDVNITKDTVATTNLVLNDDQGNALKTLEGINYSTKSLELTEPTYFVPDENVIIFAYNMEFICRTSRIKMLDNLKKYRIILASNSPRRKELLSGLGVAYEVRTLPDVDESYPDALQGGDIPLYIAREKAAAYRELLQPDELMITADTIVWLDGRVLGKPRDREDALQMLRDMSGRTHEVFTGVCLTTTAWQRSFMSQTEVRFAALTEDEIEWYVDKYRPMDKAGAYGVQEWIGYVGVEYMAGSYFNIMGLPMQRLYRELKAIE